MAVRFNGGIIGSRNLTTGGGVGQATAVGIWSLNEAQVAKLAGIWPQELAQGQIPGAVRVFAESTNWVAPPGVTSVDYLIVAGGGGGGHNIGGGGGAGGYLSGSGFAVTPLTTYTITVGAGGAGDTGSRTSNGSNSVFSSLTAIGGGCGGAGDNPAGLGNGAAGGGGGGEAGQNAQQDNSVRTPSPGGNNGSGNGGIGI